MVAGARPSDASASSCLLHWLRRDPRHARTEFRVCNLAAPTGVGTACRVRPPRSLPSRDVFHHLFPKRLFEQGADAVLIDPCPTGLREPTDEIPTQPAVHFE